MQDLISVVVPIYNVELYLEKCVKSICNQTYKNLEIILVDDGSPDNCPKICDELAKDDERIVVIHKKNGGLSDARNVGIDIAKGRYIAFVDSDDYIHEEMLEKLCDVLVDNNTDMSICNYEIVDEFGNVITENSPIKDEVLTSKQAQEKLSQPNWGFFVTAWNKLYKREIFNDVRYPKGKINEDQFLAHLTFDKCNDIATISQKLYFYVQRSGSITANKKSVSCLDDIEALCNRVQYYDEKSETELKTLSAKVLIDVYNKKRCLAVSQSLNDKARIKQIDKLVAKTLIGCASTSNKQRLIICFPNVYSCIINTKNAIQIRNRISRLKFFIKLIRKNKVIINFAQSHNIANELIDSKTITIEAKCLYKQEKQYCRMFGSRKIIINMDCIGSKAPKNEYMMREIINDLKGNEISVVFDDVIYDTSLLQGEEFLNETYSIFQNCKNIELVTNDRCVKCTQMLFKSIKVKSITDFGG